MPKWLKFILGLLLLPLCAGAVPALVKVVRVSGRASEVWVPLGAGAACWLVVFALLPKPMWIYVVGHELTHVVWSWLFGGKVKKFKATSQGGEVVITKSNFLVALAPYFFPLYAVLVVLVFLVGHLIWGWARWTPGFHLLLGAAYAFHLTLTWEILQTRQSDITGQGYLFSGVIIFLGNVLVLLVSIPLLTGQGRLLTVLGWWLEATGALLKRLSALV
ncbi:MAG: hypothetical protein HZA92_15205 [Verrucomicrobia bacterium]|nr:hypothetical protein [Verrucomicrobiota bacterium]